MIPVHPDDQLLLGISDERVQCTLIKLFLLGYDQCQKFLQQ